MIRRRTWLKRSGWIARTARLLRFTPLPPVNVARARRRLSAYRAHLRSAYFRALRLVVFARDGNRCADCQHVFPTRELTADHLTYARFGHELAEDLATRCAGCHRKKDAWKVRRRAVLRAWVTTDET